VTSEKIVGYSKTEARLEMYKLDELEKGAVLIKKMDKA